MSKSNFLKSILTVCFFVSVASAALAQNATSPISTGASREVKGTVFDGQEQPLMGVAVLLAGTTTGGVTDLEGNYSIEVPIGDVTLEFVSLGYSTKRVALPASQSVLNVYLTESSTELDATVVVGYGTTKKVNLTGAVSVVESDAISNRSSANLGSILQGTVSFPDLG